MATAVDFFSLSIQQLDNIHAYQLDTEHLPNKSILREVHVAGFFWQLSKNQCATKAICESFHDSCLLASIQLFRWLHAKDQVIKWF